MYREHPVLQVCIRAVPTHRILYLASWSAWASTCSPNATRTRTYDWRRSDGTIVPDGECTSRGISLSESETGAVYSGCSYNWQTGAWSGYNSSCSANATQIGGAHV